MAVADKDGIRQGMHSEPFVEFLYYIALRIQCLLVLIESYRTFNVFHYEDIYFIPVTF